MISWNKFLLILCLTLCFGGEMTAQTIKYYKLTKTKINGVINTNASGGQFIRIYDNFCYDCDRKGNGVGNGQLSLKSSSDYIIFQGESYFGKDSYYKFNKSFTILNIITPKGDIYAYKCIVPSPNISTSTLIRSHSSTNGMNIQNGSTYSNPYPPSYPSQNNNYIENTSSPQPDRKTNINHKCAYCNGTGQITKDDNAPSNFGIEKPKQQCPICGKWYNPNVFIHYHQKCSHCGGTGFAR